MIYNFFTNALFRIRIKFVPTIDPCRVPLPKDKLQRKLTYNQIYKTLYLNKQEHKSLTLFPSEHWARLVGAHMPRLIASSTLELQVWSHFLLLNLHWLL